jgi:hypothetical protein
MELEEAIRTRRTIKVFGDAPVAPLDEILVTLD